MGNVFQLSCFETGNHVHDHAGTKIEDLKIEREKEGRCGECGRKTHEISTKYMFRSKKVALNKPGEVDDGCCLICYPPQSELTSSSSSASSDNGLSTQRSSQYSGASFQIVVASTTLKPIVDQKNDTEMTKYVLKNGDKYGIKLRNEGHQIVQAVLKIDGCDVGTFIVEPNVDYEPIERPVSIDKKFTFYTVRAVRSAQNTSNPEAGAKAVAMSGIRRINGLDDHLNGLIQCDFTPECEWTINVKKENTGEIFQFIVTPSISIYDFKTLVEKKTRVPFSRQMLKQGDIELVYGMMSKYCTQNESTFMLSEVDCYVCIQTLIGKVFQIQIDHTDTVSNLMCKIRDHEGIPVDQQRLVFAGKTLEGHRKLLDYSVQRACTIHLILRLRGGGCNCGGCTLCSSNGIESKDGSTKNSEETIQGATTLQGTSDQKFKSYSDTLYLDETQTVTIYARLVGTDELTPMYHDEAATSLRSVSLPSAPPPPSPV